MSTGTILVKSEAVAVRDAVCALNNVLGIANFFFRSASNETIVEIALRRNGSMFVMAAGQYEEYDSFAAFVAAYEVA